MIEALLQAERLLLHGRVDDAERIYQAALEQDPLNAIAVVGLARVALERGDDSAARAHARHALELDPQNEAALRMDERLSEILAERQPPRTAPPGAEPSQATDTYEPRPSESAVFARNPSMAEHRHMESARDSQGANPGGEDSGGVPRETDQAGTERRGLLRRLLGQ